MRTGGEELWKSQVQTIPSPELGHCCLDHLSSASDWNTSSDCGEDGAVEERVLEILIGRMGKERKQTARNRL